MHRFFRPRIRAVLARCLLGLWLFTLAQGFAHACLLQISGAHHADPSVSELAHQHEHGDPSSGQALCVKACDELQDSLLLKSSSWVADPGLALAPAFSTWQPLRLGAGFVCDSDPSFGGSPPISIRFLRLTL